MNAASYMKNSAVLFMGNTIPRIVLLLLLLQWLPFRREDAEVEMATCEESSITVDDPSDWPSDFRELRVLDSLLRCSICFEYFNIAVTPTRCCHNYCSLCARKHISYKAHCPSCHVEMRQSQLKSNRVLDEIVKVFKALRPKLLSMLKEYKDLKLKWKESVQLNDRRKISSLQESNKSSMPAQGSSTAKPSRKQKDRINEMEDDDDFQEKKKRNDDKRRFSGSSTSSLPDFESRPAYYSKDERYLESFSEACLDSDATQLPDSCDNLQLPKMRPQDSDDSTEFSEPDVKRRKIGDEERKKTNEKSKEDKTLLETEDLVSSDMEGRHLLNIEDNTVLQRATSNDFLPVTEGECRKKLPELVISGFGEKQLRNKLREYGLSSKGTKKALRNRLKNYWLLYNSQCDALNPMPVSDIIRQVESTERMQKKLDKGNIVLQTFDLSKSHEEKQEFNEKYYSFEILDNLSIALIRRISFKEVIKHKEQFNSLIEDVCRRGRKDQQRNSTNEDTVTGTLRQTIESATVVSDTTRNADIVVEEEEPQNGEETVQKQTASFVISGRPSPIINPSLASEDDAQELAEAEAIIHDYSNLQDTELCRTMERRSCSRAKESKLYRSPEYKALELLTSAVSIAIPVVEKLHATVCRTSFSPSSCNSTEKSLSKIGEAGGNTRNGGDASISKEGPLYQKTSLMSARASHTATGFTNVRGKEDTFVQKKDMRRTFCRTEQRDEPNSAITISDSDEELANKNELVERDWLHSTPFLDPVKDTPEITAPPANIPSASSINSFKSRDSFLSTTPTRPSRSYRLRRQRRRESPSCISDEETKKGGDDSRRVGNKVKRNILMSRKDESMLKINESTPKKCNSKVKKKHCRSQRITSFFSKVDDEKGNVKNETGDSSSKLFASDRALFNISSSDDSDLEPSTVILEKRLGIKSSPSAGDTDVKVSCASGGSSRSRTLRAAQSAVKSEMQSTAQSTARSTAQRAAHCTMQSISESTMQNANIHSELEEQDSDEDFLSRIRHSPRKRRAVVKSSSSEKEDSSEEIPPRSCRSRINAIESDTDLSPTCQSSSRTTKSSSDMIESTELESDASPDSEKSFLF